MLSEAFAYHERKLRERPEVYGEVLPERLLAGGLFTAAEYVQAPRLRRRLRAEVAATLREVDVLAAPTTRAAAPTFETVYDPSFAFPRYKTAPFKMAGIQPLALPCGFTSAGLPRIKRPRAAPAR